MSHISLKNMKKYKDRMTFSTNVKNLNNCDLVFFKGY